MRAVNLLPVDTSGPKLGWNSELSAGIAFTLIVAVAVLGGFVVERSHATAARQRLAAAQTRLADASTQPNAKQAPLQIPAVLSQAQPWHLALDSALSTRVSWDTLLTQLEYVVPARVVLTSVSFGSAAGATASTSTTVSLGGSAYSLHDIAVFISTLERVPKISQVSLVTAAANTGSNVSTFQITAQVALPVAPVAPTSPAGTTTTTGGQA